MTPFWTTSPGGILFGSDFHKVIATDIAVIGIIVTLAMRWLIAGSRIDQSEKRMLKQLGWLAGFVFLGCSVWVWSLS